MEMFQNVIFARRIFVIKNLVFVQLVKKLMTFYGARPFINIFAAVQQ